jgi:hypothetical protein
MSTHATILTARPVERGSGSGGSGSPATEGFDCAAGLRSSPGARSSLGKGRLTWGFIDTFAAGH